jgi:hypothetical protein
MAKRETAEETIARVRAAMDAERRNALGGLREAKDRRDADQERAIRIAADNLLDKAVRRLDGLDEAGALRFVERALALTTDASAPGEDGALAVHLFVWDVLREVALEADDDGWLDVAEIVADGMDADARLEWCDALLSLEEDLEPDAPELRRIDDIAGRIPEREPLEDVPLERRPEVVMQLLRGVVSVTR